MKKIILGGICAVLVLGIVAGAVWWWSRPQTIVFDDGSKLVLLAVQYGKHHTPPRGGSARGLNTTNNTLVAWIRETYDAQNYHNFQFYAYDKKGTACVNVIYAMGNNRNRGDEIVGLRFDAFPRRQGKFILRVQENSNGGMDTADTGFVIHTPRGSFSRWAPDPTPSTQVDDDLSVTLTKLATGSKLPFMRNGDDPDDAMNKGVAAVFQVQRNGQSVTNWQPVAAETFDATGNRVQGQIADNRWQDGVDTVDYQFGLWPDEPAWKIRFEFSQQSGFTSQELWTVPKIPVQPGKQQDFWNSFNGRNQSTPSFAETDLNGYHLKIFPAQQFTDMPPNSQPQGGLTVQVTPALRRPNRRQCNL